MQVQKKYLNDFLKKSFKNYRIVVGVIFVLETLFAIRTACFRDLSDKNHLIYLISYAFLGVTSLIVFLLLSKEKGKYYLKGTRLNTISMIYASLILMWGSCVSVVDIRRGDYPVVFITVLFAVAALTLMKPLHFLMQSFIEMGVIVGFYLYVNHFEEGFLQNIILLYGVALLIAIHNFKVGNKNYEKSQYMKELSYSDSMTSAKNRRALDETVERLIVKGKPFFFIVGDIDFFKDINDEYGHLLGDECIRLVAEKLEEDFPQNVFRYGGDEFVVISNESKEEIAKILESYTKGIRHKDVVFNMSFGVKKFVSGMSEKELMRSADRMLYHSKDVGKATVTFADM